MRFGELPDSRNLMSNSPEEEHADEASEVERPPAESVHQRDRHHRHRHHDRPHAQRRVRSLVSSTVVSDFHMRSKITRLDLELRIYKVHKDLVQVVSQERWESKHQLIVWPCLDDT